jgi:hypothetical protein
MSSLSCFLGLSAACWLFVSPAMGRESGGSELPQAIEAAKGLVEDARRVAGKFSAVPEGGGWSIERDSSKEKAVAVAGAYSTLASLAEQLALPGGEISWLSWLSYTEEGWRYAAGGCSMCTADKVENFNELFRGEAAARRALLPGERFEVPNVVAAIWAGELGGLGKFAVSWKEDMDYLRARGFMVVELTNDDGSDALKKAYIEKLTYYSQQRMLYGLFVTGHGPSRGWGLNVGESVDEAHFPLLYRLGFGIINTCASAKTCASMVETARYCTANAGLMIPIVQTVHPQDLIRAGDLGTRTRN